jgi:hypothetical protein
MRYRWPHSQSAKIRAWLQKFNPRETRGLKRVQSGAVASVVSFADDGLFLDSATNKNTGIVDVLMRLAEEADEARRRL